MKYLLLKRLLFSYVLLLTGTLASATPDCPIVTGRFNGLSDGTTINNSSTGWYIDATQVASTGYFAVKSNRFHAQELGGEGRWFSKVFSTAGYSNFQVAVKVTSEGDMNSSEYVKIYYKINGGAEVLLDQRTGNFGTIDFISPVLTGNNVQLVVKIYNYNNGGSQTSKYYIEEYRVFKDHGPCVPGSITVSASAGNGGVLTCANPSLTLAASSTGSSVSYSWTGPGGFTSTSQNPSVSVAGTYTVVGTNSTGSGSASVTVSENKTAPGVSATGASLACGTSVSISATSPTAGVTYSWTGPGGFTSSSQNPTVNTAGTYTVTVTNPVNGCTSSTSVQVTAGAVTPVTVWEENFSLADSVTDDNGSTSWSIQNSGAGMFAVKSNEFKVSNIGTGAEATWTSGVISITGKSNVTVSADVRSGIVGGGALENSGSSLDYIRFYYKINGGAEVMFSEHLGTINGNSSSNTAIAVGSLAGSTIQVVIRARTTASDELYFFDNVKVSGTNGSSATINTAVSGTITCSSTAQLFATASGATISSYAWTGPNGFTSTQQNPVINQGGLYIVTGTLAGGCTTTASINVTENKTAPDIMASGGSLVCLPSVTLNVNSAVAGATYSWTGPAGYTSNLKNPTVSAAGTYTATVTNPANGCTASMAVQVTGAGAATDFWLENFTYANGTTAGNGATVWSLQNTGAGTFSVQNNELMASFSAANEGVWSSAVINIASKSNVVISVDLKSGTGSSNDYLEDDDYIQVYYKLDNGAETLLFGDVAGLNGVNNGTSTATVTSSPLNGATLQVIIKVRNSHSTERYYFDNVKLNGTENTTVNAVASAGSSLTCTSATAQLFGTTSATGATFNWSGPNGFISTEQNPVVSVAGIYTLTIVNASGCSASDTALLQQVSLPPANLTVTPETAVITCANNSHVLTASSSTPGVTFSWSGPNGFTGTTAAITVTTPGNYIVTATNPASGCSASDTVAITENIELPVSVAIVRTPAEAVLTCTITSITLAGSSATPGVSYTWSGPNGYSASVATAQAVAPGTYELTVTNSASGCTATVAAIVTQNNTVPVEVNAVIGNPSLLTCTDTSVNLTGSAASTGVSYAWSGPGNFTATTAAIAVSAPGNYTLTVTDTASGCTDTASTLVAQNITPPAGVTASFTNELNCYFAATDIAGTSTTAGVTYSWTGPGGFTASTAIANTDAPGTYNLKVTNPANGCFTQASTVVVENRNPPANVTATNNGPLTCENTEITISGSSSTPGVDYFWTGPADFIGFSASELISEPGEYLLTVTDLNTGCTDTASTVVIGELENCDDRRIATNVNKSTVASSITETGFAYRAYPNPFSNKTLIEFRSPVNAKVQIEVYNSLGGREKILFSNTAKANETYQFQLNGSNLRTGVYYCIIRVNQQLYSKKLLLIK